MDIEIKMTEAQKQFWDDIDEEIRLLEKKYNKRARELKKYCSRYDDYVMAINRLNRRFAEERDWIINFKLKMINECPIYGIITGTRK